jgi:multidrug efflux pump
MLISGAQVTTVRDGIEKVGVVARAIPSERLDLGGVGDLTITSRNGLAVPLQQVAKIEYAHEEPILWRRNRDMAITVRSDVVDGVQAPDVTSQITPKLKPIIDHLEPAYRIEPGGAFEESAKGNASIFILFPLMVMVMLTP